MEKGIAVKVIRDLERPDIVDRMDCKLVYHVRNAKVVEGKTLWPDRTDVDDVRVLVGETYRCGEWVSLRSSSLIKINETDGVFETLNSVYRVINTI